ncbi:MAG: sarcosine oxidase subunit delta [Pseudomonadota bacterium]
MLMIMCPYCGVLCAETELMPGGQAHLKRMGPGSSDDAFADYLFTRRNPKGVHFERWRHVYGCGKWFHVARCTLTLEVLATYRADVVGIPDDVIAAVQARRPDWRPELWR